MRRNATSLVWPVDVAVPPASFADLVRSWRSFSSWGLSRLSWRRRLDDDASPEQGRLVATFLSDEVVASTAPLSWASASAQVDLNEVGGLKLLVES